MKKIDMFKEESIQGKKMIVGYGIGENYERHKNDFADNGITFDYLCDARWRELGTTYDGIPIISPDSLAQMEDVCVYVMVKRPKAYIEIVRFLEEHGILYKSLSAYMLGKKHNSIIKLIEQAAADHTLAAIEGALQDPESRILFDARMRMSIYADPGELYLALFNLPRGGTLQPVSEVYFCNADNDLLETVRKLLTYQEMRGRKKVVLCKPSIECYAWVRDLNLKVDAILMEEMKQGLFPEIPRIDMNTAVEKFSEAIFISGEHQDGDVQYALISQGIPEKNFKKCHTCWKSQYFDEPFLEVSDHEIFVDAGALNLNNTFDFIRLCKGKYDKIYALEPDENLYDNCVKRLEQAQQSEREKINLFRAAAWSEDTKVSYTDFREGSGYVSGNGGIMVEGRSIDSILQGDRVTYIKMDIEGAELEALKGAEKSIRKWKPRLAVCIYHKPEDIIEIPRYILSLVPDYKMYIRHYSTCIAETVLYCL